MSRFVTAILYAGLAVTLLPAVATMHEDETETGPRLSLIPQDDSLEGVVSASSPSYSRTFRCPAGQIPLVSWMADAGVVLDRQLYWGNEVTLRWHSTFQAIDLDCASVGGCTVTPRSVFIGGAGASKPTIVSETVCLVAR